MVNGDFLLKIIVLQVRLVDWLKCLSLLRKGVKKRLSRNIDESCREKANENNLASLIEN